jgi:hypothetical protein
LPWPGWRRIAPIVLHRFASSLALNLPLLFLGEQRELLAALLTMILISLIGEPKERSCPL